MESRRNRREMTVAVISAVGFLTASAHADRQYGVLDLGGLVTPRGINNSGVVTGSADSVPGYAFRTAPYSAVNASTDGLMPTDTQGTGRRVNDAGIVVGERVDTDPHAFKYSGTTFTDLGPLVSASNGRTYACDINNLSTPQITGIADTPSVFAPRAYIYQGTALTILGTLGGDRSGGSGINDSGQVTGSSNNTSGIFHAFRTGSNGSGMADLGTLLPSDPNSQSSGVDINNSGHVIGSSDSNTGGGAFFYDNTNGMQELEDIDTTYQYSFARAINHVDQIVGQSYLDAYHPCAALWTGLEIQDLNDLIHEDCGWELIDATDINEPYKVGASGEIVGTGIAPDTGYHGFMLIPIRRGEWNVNSNGNWTTTGNWTGDVPNKEASVATFDDVISAPRTVTVDEAVTVGEIYINNSNAYTIAGMDTLTLNNLDCEAVVEVQAGSHTISAPVFLRNSTIFNIVSSMSVLDVTQNITTYPPDGPSVVDVTKNGSGKLLVNHICAAALTINGGLLEMRANGGSSGVSKVSTLSIATGAKLDLTNNKLITTSPAGTQTNGTYNGVQGLVQSGYNGGSWDGDGIITSQSDALGTLTTIGVSTGALALFLGPTDTDMWAGQTINGDSVMVMYTYIGDANLDGFLDGTDYFYIDNGASTPGANGFGNGDFNYDGVIDATDYFYLDNNIIAQGTPFYAGSGVDGGAELLAGVTAVPEPITLGATLLVATTTLLRRRGNQTA